MKTFAAVVLVAILLVWSKQSAGQGMFEANARADDAKCRQLGFKRGTEGYSNCRIRLQSERSMREPADELMPVMRR